MATFSELSSRIQPKAVPSLAGVDPDPRVTLTPSDYFVVSRLDGRADVRTLASLVGQSVAALQQVLIRLVAAGCATLDGVTQEEAFASLSSAPAPAPPPVKQAPARAAKPETSATTEKSGLYALGGEKAETSKRKAPKAADLSREMIPDGWPVAFEQFTFDPVVMSSGDALTTEQKQVVLYYHYHLKRVSYYRLFGVEQQAGRRDIKASYFNLSKAFHPDRWFRQDVGEFGGPIEDVFKWLNRAYSVLGSPRKRKGYNQLLKRGYLGEWQLERGGAPPPRPRASNAGRETRRTFGVLAARARQAEASGDFSGAVELYGRALQVDPTPELRIRLVECMLKANVQPQEIEPHLSAAREQGGDEKSVLLLDAAIARRLNQIERAISSYLAVLELEPDNPVAKLGVSSLRGNES